MSVVSMRACLNTVLDHGLMSGEYRASLDMVLNHGADVYGEYEPSLAMLMSMVRVRASPVTHNADVYVSMRTCLDMVLNQGAVV